MEAELGIKRPKDGRNSGHSQTLLSSKQDFHLLLNIIASITAELTMRPIFSFDFSVGMSAVSPQQRPDFA